MKKIFLLLAMVLFSVNVFADSRSCTVYNADGVIASLKNSTDDVDNWGIVTAVVTLNAPAPRDVEVVVNVYDLADGIRITYGTVYISAGQKSSSQSFNVDKSKYKICMFKINSASCQ